jgi:hypothetical protein
MTAELTIERAMSDYLAVSRNATLYGPEYEQAEARAWERLQEAIAAEGAPEPQPEVAGA